MYGIKIESPCSSPEGQVLTIDVEAKAKEAVVFRLREMLGEG